MFDSVWYDNLSKPFLNPPGWIFSPVWIILYGTLLAAVIIYSIVITKKSKFFGYVIFTVHMVLNLLWSPVFFVLHKINIALVIVVLMDITAILLIRKFFSVSKIAGLILIPYFLWIMFATYLNLEFLMLN